MQSLQLLEYLHNVNPANCPHGLYQHSSNTGRGQEMLKEVLRADL